MKRTDKLTTLIAVLLFTAVLLYVAAYGIRAMRDTTVTAQAVAVELRPGGVANGIVIRDEAVLTSGEPYIDVTAKDGSKVAAGAQLATAMGTQQGLERANRLHALELEIARISTALEELSSAEDLTARDQALQGAVDQLTAAVARHELGDLDSQALNLRSLLFSGSAAGADETELKALQRELDSLRNSTDGDTRQLYAAASGVFSTMLDGYESLSSRNLPGLTPAGLSQLLDLEPELPQGAYGKLVEGFRWYFAAAMSQEDAASLREGRTATLNFGRWYGADIYARVQSISPPEDGVVAVVFSCDTALADTLAMRTVTANVVFESYSGIRVPVEALQQDQEGQQYVWTVTAMQLERKNVEVLYQDGDVAVVARSAQADALREGNTVVVSGEDLYEGKVME